MGFDGVCLFNNDCACEISLLRRSETKHVANMFSRVWIFFFMEIDFVSGPLK